jgi:hypothetical protein
MMLRWISSAPPAMETARLERGGETESERDVGETRDDVGVGAV